MTEQDRLLTSEEAERIFEKITFEKDCWIWNASVNQSGVPVVKFRGTTTAVRGLMKRHYRVIEARAKACKVTDCVNPAHPRG